MKKDETQMTIEELKQFRNSVNPDEMGFEGELDIENEFNIEGEEND